MVDVTHDRGTARAIMDALWPMLDDLIAPDVWNDIEEEVTAALTTAQARAAAQEQRIAAMREALAMAIAEMMRASGRLEVIAGCNEDRRIAAALSGTCDFARAALSEPTT